MNLYKSKTYRVFILAANSLPLARLAAALSLQRGNQLKIVVRLEAFFSYYSILFCVTMCKCQYE